MPVYDAVVIGAGNGGLTAALTLAKAGRRILLLERHNVPGGCATSFVRGRFEFEVALHQLSGLGSVDRPGPLRVLLSEMGVIDKLAFVEMENLYRVSYPGVLDITLKAEREAAIGTLQQQFPAERDAIARFFELVYEFSLQLVQGIFFRDPHISKEKYPLYFKYAFRNAQEVLDEYFDDPLLKVVLGVYWGYVGVPPSRLPFGDLAVILWAYIEFKPYHLKGGSQALSNALLDTFLQMGGEARFNCAVRKIIVENGAVKGVVTEDGERVDTRYVMSNASTIQTYIDLIDAAEVPDSQFEYFKSKTIGPSAFTVYLGFDCEPSEIGIRESSNFILTTTDMNRAFGLWKTLEPQEWALFTCYDVSDPEFSPPGACQAALVSLQYAEPWYRVPPHQYAETKYRYADAMLKMAETIFPNLRHHIEEAEVATPLTHLRYLGHPGGAIYGFDQYAKDSPYFRMDKSPIKGLYHAGAWVAGGGFQPTLTSGRSTARSMLKSMNNK